MSTRYRVNEDTDPKRVHSSESDDKASLISPVKVEEGEEIENYARQLAFMNEEVEVTIMPSHDPDDTTKLVTISVNGKEFYFLRGQPRKCPRYVLEVIATAKHQAWNFGYKQAVNGQTVQTQDSHVLLRFPHQYRDSNPKGHAWYDSIRDKTR